MANVFISYSRKDKEAARKLAEACKAQDLEVWIDWEGIEPTVDWWKEVEKGIEGADNFLFLISPDSTSSPVCKRELDHAIQNGKRLIPVVARATKSDTITSELRTLNWIYLGDAESADDFESAFGKLTRAIKTDYDWVQVHRQLQVKALEWERSNRENSFLLRGKELQEAESQLATNSSKEPHPTDLQREYALASRQAADRQRRITTGITIIVGIVLAALAIFGWVQAGRATTNAQTAQSESTRAFHNATTAQAASTLALDNAATAQANAEEAQRQEKIARARELAAEARAEDQPIRSLLFSVEAFQRLDDQAQRNSLLSGLQNSPNLKTILHGHGASVWAAAFSPDGKTLAAGAANGTVTLWNVSNLSHPLQLGDSLDSHTPDVWSVAFSPDGNTLVAGTVDHTIVFWDVSNPAAPKQLGDPLTGHFEDVRRVVFSPDGKTLASSGCGNKEADVCDQGQIILWDVSNPSAPTPLREPLSAHTQDVESLAFSPDGKTLASGSLDNTIILWNVSDPQKPTQLGSPLSRHSGPVLDLAFSPNGNVLASGSLDKTIILWDVSRLAAAIPLGEPLKGVEDQVWSVAFSPDGKTLASGGVANHIILWDVTNPESPVQVGAPLAGHTDNILSVVFSPDGKTLASGSVDQTVILWDVSDPPPPLQVGSPLQFNDFVLTMDFSPDGKTLAFGSWDTSLNLLDVSNPELPGQLGGPLHGHIAEIRSVAFSPDGKTLASASCGNFEGEACIQGEIILWDVSNPGPPAKLGGPLRGHKDIIQSIVFSPDGKTLASGSWDSTIILWNVSNPAKPVPLGDPLQGYQGSLRTLAISPDGKILAASGDDLSIMFWDISNPAAPQSLGELPVKHTNFISSLAFSPDGKTLASGSWDKSVMLWNVSDPKAPFRLSEPLPHKDVVFRVAFSPDGKMLASTSCGRRDADQTCTQGDVLLWDVSNPVAALQLGQPLSGHKSDMLAVTFSPNSRLLASSSLDGTIILWDVDPRSWADRACQKVGRNFTPTEWAQYFPNEEYHATCKQWIPLSEQPTPTP